MPSARDSERVLSKRSVALGLVIVGVVGAMALFRSHTAAASNWFSGGVSNLMGSNAAAMSNSEIQPLANLDQAMERIAQRVAPAVVQIQVTSRATEDEGDGGDNPFSQFFGPMGPGGQQTPQFEIGVGSGVIISPDGLIVTNNHVIDGGIDIQVTLHDRRVLPGKVVGADPLTDLALVRINATGLPNLTWGDSRQLKQGDSVFAFGNPFGLLTFTMTRGIVSGLGRPNMGERVSQLAPADFIQTDAAINPGNSGGPLVDIHGNVVGINAFIYTSSGTFSGAGFAIPSELAKPTLMALAEHGKVDRGYLGIVIEDMTPELAPFFKVPTQQQGALITEVDPNTPASHAGLKDGDVITELNGQKVIDSAHLQIATGQTAPGSHVVLTVDRAGEPMSINAVLGTPPAAMTAAAPPPKPPAPTSGIQMGITPADLTPSVRDQLQVPEDLHGVLVERVTPGGPAYNASPSLHRFDIILAVDGVPVSNSDEWRAALQKIGPGQNVLIRFWEGGQASYSVVHPNSGGSPTGQP